MLPSPRLKRRSRPRPERRPAGWRARRWAAAACLAAQVAAAVPAWAAPAPEPAKLEAAGLVRRPGLAAATAEGAGSTYVPAPQRESHRRSWGIVGSGLGLATGVGLAIRLKNEADSRYHVYRGTADPDAAHRALREAQRYDRAVLLGWSLAEVSFAALFYFLIHQEKQSLIPVHGKPVVSADGNGVKVGVEVSP